MSRVGQQPVVIPAGVDINASGQDVTIKGPKGELSLKLNKGLELKQADGRAVITRKHDSQSLRAKHGLNRALLASAIEGVNQGYSKKLEVVGVGFRAQLSGQTLTLKLGYSHDSVYQLPSGIEAEVDQNIITISGADKQRVGQVAAEIRKLRTPEPYKGKGIKYIDEYIIRKAGKAAGAAAKE